MSRVETTELERVIRQGVITRIASARREAKRRDDGVYGANRSGILEGLYFGLCAGLKFSESEMRLQRQIWKCFDRDNRLGLMDFGATRQKEAVDAGR